MELLKFYSKLHKYCEDDNIEIALTSERGLLLDFVDKEGSMNKNKGLAMYLNDPFSNYVSSIQYSYARGGYIEFLVYLNCSKNKRIDSIPIKEYIKNFISGQISDGWGENGIYVVESGWIGDPATVCVADYNLIDYKEYRKLNPDPDFIEMENGIGA